ncbi:hypothetical protein OF83DRAFT_1172796 [Amylostereum chailletii]|nr:hypothetical protein OF83DRAFT_1172796 [Amylostereum chailletii]
MNTPLTQRGQKPAAITHAFHDVPSHNPICDFASLRFPSHFSSDFAPATLVYASPSLTNGMTYSEGIHCNANSLENFGIVRPTIKLPLEQAHRVIRLAWRLVYLKQLRLSARAGRHPQPSSSADQGVDMKPTRSSPPTHSRHGLGSGGGTPSSSSSRPILSVRTNATGSRSSGSSTTAANPPAPSPNTAPGSVKAECSIVHPQLALWGSMTS